MWTFREFNYSDKDYEDMLAIHDSMWPHWPMTVEEWKFNDQSRPEGIFYERFIVEDGSDMCGYGVLCETYWADSKDQYHATFNTRPDVRCQGIASKIHEMYLEKIKTMNATSLMAKTREDQKAGMEFLANRGFDQIMRYPRSHLDIGEFDFLGYAGLEEKLNSEGIDIKTLGEMIAQDRCWKEKLLDLTHAILRDVPMPEPFKEMSLEQFQKEALDDPGFHPAAWSIALDGNKYVGMSNIWIPARKDSGLVQTGLTGVRREYRRRGICTALKVDTFKFAREQRINLIETDNEENNPMYQINLKLGFKPQPAWLDYRLEF